jgi:hypothetical protein
MRLPAPFVLLLSLLLVLLPAHAQTVNMNHPQEIHAQTVPSADTIMARMHNVQLQQDAHELSQLCSSITSQMDGLKQGVLQRDVIKKLQRLEKLSRRVREELTR